MKKTERRMVRRLCNLLAMGSALTRRGFLGSAAAAPALLLQKKRPNILWLMTDEQRCDSIGAYGSSWAQTPTLDEIARNGVLFENALTPAPVCVPCRVSLLSGCYPAKTGVMCNSDIPKPDQPFLISTFSENGYQTCSVGKHHYNSGRKLFEKQVQRMLPEALDYMNYRKGRDYRDYNAVRYPRDPWHWLLAGRFPEDPSRTSSALDVSDALSWCESLDRTRPFLLRVSFNDPHTPVVAPAPYDTAIDPAKIRIPGPGRLPAGAPAWERSGLATVQSAEPLRPAEITRIRQCYYGLVKYLDHEIARLLDNMRRMGLLENTIIAMVADHGTHLGDYGLLQKSTFYNPVVNVPFIFSYPEAILGGKVVREPVETVSLLPTLLDLCGIPLPAAVQAPSLAPSLRSGRPPQRRPVFSEIREELWHKAHTVLVREGHWKLSVPIPASTEAQAGGLYDLASDPHETRNLFSDKRHAGVVGRLRGLIEDHLSKVSI